MDMSFDGEDNFVRKGVVDKVEEEEQSPKTVEDIQANLRQEILMRKVKNEAN